jgi:hypothetical protein
MGEAAAKGAVGGRLLGMPVGNVETAALAWLAVRSINTAREERADNANRLIILHNQNDDCLGHCRNAWRESALDTSGANSAAGISFPTLRNRLKR